MGRVTFVLIGMIAIVIYLATTKTIFEDNIAQVEKNKTELPALKQLFR